MLNNDNSFVGFKLLRLELKDHHILGTNIFDFVDASDKPDSIYSSIIIGSNGTGKSELLKLILILFRNICRLERGEKVPSIKWLYLLTYLNNGRVYSFRNWEESESNEKIKSNPMLLKDGEPREFENATNTLPESIIANSIMLTDKFIVPRNAKEKEAFPMYNYLGVRHRPQQASTRSYVRKTVEFIVEKVDSSDFKYGIEQVTDFLGLTRSVNVLFNTSYTTRFFKGNTQKSDLDAFFSQIEETYSMSTTAAPFKLNHYQSLQNETGAVEEMCEFMNSLFLENHLEDNPRSSVKTIRYDITNNDSHERLKRDYRFLNHLRKLGLIKPPEVSLIKANQSSGVDISSSSSGEFHFLSTMVGLMATVRSNSLILIDEPEISLHPNWQMKYLSFLRQLFSREQFKTCQLIIATHSHFLVSDLKGDSATIIGLKKVSDSINTVSLQMNTFGWSAEQVLLDVFDVPSTRNHFVAERLGLLLDFIASEESNTELIKEKYISLKLDQLSNLSEEDPLYTVLDKIKTEFING